jgi:hypothetical protein
MPGALQYKKPFIWCFLLDSAKSASLSGPVALVQPAALRVALISGLSVSSITCRARARLTPVPMQEKQACRRPPTRCASQGARSPARVPGCRWVVHGARAQLLLSGPSLCSQPII